MTRPVRRTDRGASAVEFALVMPILLLLIFGLIQYGLWFWAIQGGADSARHAARLAAVGNPDCAEFLSEVEATRGPWASNAFEVTRTYENAEGHTASAVEVGDRVLVTVTFNSIDLNFPFVPFVDDGEVSESAKARVERLDTTSAPEDCP